MSSEKERMLAGELYVSGDPELDRMRRHCRRLLREINHADPDDRDTVRAAIGRLLGRAGENPWVEPPFFCDYGANIRVGNNFYANFNCVILDPGTVDVGDDVLLGPAVQIYTATHPLDAAERASGRELARPIRIGSRVWIGGGAIVLPGVTIGDDAVIGAGAVVARDVPPRVVVAGNPARIVRRL